MAEKTKKPGFFSRYIGGLLGEDAESMTQDDRRRATLSLLGSFGRNYLSAGSGDESLAAMRASRAAERKAVDDARRTAAAQARMPDIASRIFGGTGGRSIEALPGVGGEAMPMTSRRVPTREGAREALGMLYGTQEGRDAATMAPGLVDVAKEGVTGRIVGGSVYDTMTGRFDAPRTAPKPKTIVGEVDLTDRVIVSYSDGTEKTFMKGKAQQAAGDGGSMFLTPEEIARNGIAPGTIIRRRDGAVVQKPDAGGAGNERMRTGQVMSRDAALQYAANITGMPVADLRQKTPVEIEALMVKRGGRVLQGGLARMLAGAPGIGGIAKTVIDAANADLMAPATSGGAGIALTQNPTGPITGPDVDVGRMQFPNALYPIDVQAQMIRSILEKGGQVEEYDAKGNKVR
jgi:hypothetical protein